MYNTRNNNVFSINVNYVGHDVTHYSCIGNNIVYVSFKNGNLIVFTVQNTINLL